MNGPFVPTTRLLVAVIGILAVVGLILSGHLFAGLAILVIGLAIWISLAMQRTQPPETGE
ncbi:MAG TPA: hypothetical protein VKZ58_03965 [Longimicrobiales bacterium]|nr:hypothetical protein [Longimicrobiales bacterium]